jgi:hypothetical protein
MKIWIMPMVAKETNTQFDKSAIQTQKKNCFPGLISQSF